MCVTLAKPIVNNERTDDTTSRSIWIPDEDRLTSCLVLFLLYLVNHDSFGERVWTRAGVLVREVGSRSFYTMSQIML
jgi:hypothetical protein